MPKCRSRIPILIALTALVLWFIVAPPRFLSEMRFILRHAELGAIVVAKDLCYGIFLQNRDSDDIRANELGPYLDPRLSWVKADVDTEQREVRTRVLGLISARVTQRTDGSCERHGQSLEELAPRTLLPSPDPAPWPEGDALALDARDLVADYDGLKAAVEAEFELTASGVDRGTRSVLIVHHGRLVYERHALVYPVINNVKYKATSRPCEKACVWHPKSFWNRRNASF